MHNSARSYDPATGSWTSPDTWRGLLKQPETLARYQYVSDNPATYLDPDGHLCARRGAGDGLPLGCGSPPVKAHSNVTMPPPAPPYVPKKKDTPKPKGPGQQDRIQQRHLDSNYVVPTTFQPCGPGVAPTICKYIDSHQDVLGPAYKKAWLAENKRILGQISAVAGGIGIFADAFALAWPVAAPVAVPLSILANGVSVVSTCLADWNTRSCLLGGYIYVATLGLGSAGSIKALPQLGSAMLKGLSKAFGWGGDVGSGAALFNDSVQLWWDQKVFE